MGESNLENQLLDKLQKVLLEMGHSLMEYALAGMDSDLFVSKYQLELPPKRKCNNSSKNR